MNDLNVLFAISVILIFYGLFPCLLGGVAGFFARKLSGLAGVLAAMAFLLVWLTASPPLWVSHGDYILNRLNVVDSFENILRLILSMVWYGSLGGIGGEIGGKFRKKINLKGSE